MRSTLLSKTPEADPRQLISDPDARELCGGISVMTRTRWARDPRIGWPAVAAVVCGRKFYFRRDVDALVDRLVELTASGAAVTIAPSPRHRRSAKVGGLVSG
jgi:hypothetical protein